ncbi:hypothetical protein L3X38_019836 [Prunus dulcis]|uniref:Ubiquitin-like protease family profile domain-containing protein n=1 Tax=Prunus dulcis TaxID=3755 RepID=A0AAD4WEF5_PRUDU|nr:hypothetical protein L3X38_019836 [Prunus dulcis]
MSDLIRRGRSMTTAPSSDPPAQSASAATAPASIWWLVPGRPRRLRHLRHPSRSHLVLGGGTGPPTPSTRHRPTVLVPRDHSQIDLFPLAFIARKSRHWILMIVRAKKETVYFLDPLPGTPKQPSSVECGYYVMRFMRDIIMDPSLAFENKYAKGNQEASYPQEAIDEVRNEWAETVFQFIK